MKAMTFQKISEKGWEYGLHQLMAEAEGYKHTKKMQLLRLKG
jgi:hypothetical protein